MKKILAVIPDLRGGGAERVVIELCNHWAEQGYSVEILVLQSKGDLINDVSPLIAIHSLGVDRIRRCIIPLALFIKKSRPAVIWANMWPLTIASIISWVISGRAGRIIVTDHALLSLSRVACTDVSEEALKLQLRLFYPLASGITGVSDGVASDVRRISGLSEHRVRTIYNPICIKPLHRHYFNDLDLQKVRRSDSLEILAIGGLKKEKNFALLLDAFEIVSTQLNAKLTILGEGPLRRELEEHVIRLGLTESVSMPGFVRDTHRWYMNSDLLVVSSDHEGFCNVILEALSFGLPVVSTDCPCGPSEILAKGLYGTLVPVGSAMELASAITQNLSRKQDRSSLINRAKRFSMSIISGEYLDIFFPMGK